MTPLVIYNEKENKLRLIEVIFDMSSAKFDHVKNTWEFTLGKVKAGEIILGHL